MDGLSGKVRVVIPHPDWSAIIHDASIGWPWRVIHISCSGWKVSSSHVGFRQGIVCEDVSKVRLSPGSLSIHIGFFASASIVVVVLLMGSVDP